MSSNYIHALAQRHAALERRIAEAMKSPLPDSLHITRLKKLRLAYRERFREAIRQKRKTATASRRSNWTAPYAASHPISGALPHQQEGT
ncbi:MAG: YdcH family protein [Hyphomonas sp.]